MNVLKSRCSHTFPQHLVALPLNCMTCWSFEPFLLTELVELGLTHLALTHLFRSDSDQVFVKAMLSH